METYKKKIEIRWADLDPNFHLRHSVYYDFGASARIDYLQQNGITAQFMHERVFGPVILREECVFKKEIRPNDEISIDLVLVKAREDFSRWSIRHHIYKNGHTISAVLTIDGAWLDTSKRKLVVPPEEVTKTFASMPRNEQFAWLDKM
ncbi:MAG: acyl-CoA thioesterase [Chitinophagaceae bacterium]